MRDRDDGVGFDEEALIDAWLSHAFTRSRDTFPAWDHVTTMVLDHPEDAWPLLLRMIARAPDERLGALGAGPLETLLAEHGASFGARAVEQARRDPRLRACLSAAWLDRSAVSPGIADEIAKLTDGDVLFFPIAR
jgi:hypothetical protein